MRENRKTWARAYALPSDSNSWILHSIYTRLCFPGKYFSPSHSKSATARHSAGTPPYATIETAHSSLLSFAGCSEQLLQFGCPFFISHLVVWGVTVRPSEHHTHSFTSPSCLPTWLLPFSKRTCMSTAPQDNGPLDLWPLWGKGRVNLMLRSSTAIVWEAVDPLWL